VLKQLFRNIYLKIGYLLRQLIVNICAREMKKTKTSCENIVNNVDYLEPYKEIETIEMEIPNITEYNDEIPDCNLMYDGKLM